MLDPLNARGMDTYALVLRDRGDQDSLARLRVDLKGAIGARPETFMAASTYWESCGDLDKVLFRRLAADISPAWTTGMVSEHGMQRLCLHVLTHCVLHPTSAGLVRGGCSRSHAWCCALNLMERASIWNSSPATVNKLQCH